MLHAPPSLSQLFTAQKSRTRERDPVSDSPSNGRDQGATRSWSKGIITPWPRKGSGAERCQVWIRKPRDCEGN